MLNEILKRFLDILMSLLGLLFSLPFLLFIAILIKIFTPGSIFYTQQRVGRNWKEFKIIKFRTMKSETAEDINNFEAGNISRITKLGKVLRKTKIDEIPQLINVLMGDMSLVGPRPEVAKWTKICPEKWSKILTVRPGITDNASIIFRNEEKILSESINPEKTYLTKILPVKIQLYIEYVDNHSIYGDFIIILRSLKVVLCK
jgi:lipopolysaccharide/colanic/teichoic acid biosynthesis glycosyltransferase